MQMPIHSQLYKQIKQYEVLANTIHAVDLFSKAYETTIKHLEHNENEAIDAAINEAIYHQDKKSYEKITSLVLTAIHRFTYLQNDKEYCSTLFIVPYFTIADNPLKEHITYPPVSQIEDIFRKNFLDSGLIDEAEQLHLPSIKIGAQQAYHLQYADWYEIHKSALFKSLHPERDEFYQRPVELSIDQNGDLSFFTLVVIYEDNDFTPQPAICNLDKRDLPYEEVIENIEHDLKILNPSVDCAIGIPSHCQNALDFGLEIQQDFHLDNFLKTFPVTNQLAILPTFENQFFLVSWNEKSGQSQLAMELVAYSDNEDDFIQRLIEQIAFHEVQTTYLFEPQSEYDCPEKLNGFDLNKLLHTCNPLVLQPQAQKKRVFH